MRVQSPSQMVWATPRMNAEAQGCHEAIIHKRLQTKPEHMTTTTAAGLSVTL
jgi:hypothetical protein